GKTTLAKAVMHLIDSEGILIVNGEPWKHELRREIKMVFQDPFGAFNPLMNFFDTVSEALRVHEPEMPR
ncbi:microcin ABC transporter ATP-binding protein, partial [Neisseria sp. P0003.S003]